MGITSESTTYNIDSGKIKLQFEHDRESNLYKIGCGIGDVAGLSTHYVTYGIAILPVIGIEIHKEMTVDKLVDILKKHF
ncbi:MAG: hypothetical protein HRU03_09495 [Nanoarchaeales archaeon]|nr:hypothetical protein [Nanoarchaeales archaeon]